VWEPLDGILLGTASAVGFTLVETLGQYLPDIYHSTLAAGEGVAQLASLQLLIPRVLGSVSGHMAYSGYLGYFIGLSVLRPRKRWLILGVGYLTAAGLHTLWNAAGVLSPVLLAVVGVLSYAFLGAAILKARELSPTRSQNFATRFYR
jgi:RsiW-degrading membrane proteinase PrsW (M82 family)